ncbi:MAG: hypothetical protein KatS3mg105_1498 [Gemmatales bacterium]|nr:MAG: hypothetical protein KatS3mg105_1498 [Gemmatales bacterium]
MEWLWYAIVGIVCLSGAVWTGNRLFQDYLISRYGKHLVRGFEEKPIFIIPRGQPLESAENVYFHSSDGYQLCGCYLRTPASRRLGVILFGVPYGASRWTCVPFCEKLVDAGFDVFAFEFRNQGDSESMPGYEPLHWVTKYDVIDAESAIEYLRTRPDAEPTGIGFFGVSKGAAAGLLASASNPYVRCFVTDGVFDTFTVVVPFMRKWIAIYSQRRWLQRILPSWFYEQAGRRCLERDYRNRGKDWHYVDLKPVMGSLSPRPLLMIHGAADNYIAPQIGQALFEAAKPPKEFWLVEGAKHNTSVHVAGDEYHRRVIEFFREHLASNPAALNGYAQTAGSANGSPQQTLAVSRGSSSS